MREFGLGAVYKTLVLYLNINTVCMYRARSKKMALKEAVWTIFILFA